MCQPRFNICSFRHVSYELNLEAKSLEFSGVDKFTSKIFGVSVVRVFVVAFGSSCPAIGVFGGLGQVSGSHHGFHGGPFPSSGFPHQPYLAAFRTNPI